MIRADLGKRDPQKPGRKCRPGEDESRCVFGWERLQRDAAAGHSQASFHVAAGVRSSAGGRGWAGCLAPSQGWGAGLRDPARPVRPQWEAGCPPPLRRCCPSALPARPLRPALPSSHSGRPGVPRHSAGAAPPLSPPGVCALPSRPATVGGRVSPATLWVPPLHSPHPASAPCPPVQPQWEAGCPPPLRRCCPSALPARPLHSAPLGPTCEERFVLEQASHHPQQPVLHVLAASLLTLLIPRPGQRNSIRDPCPWLRTHGIPCEPSHTRPSHVFWPGRAISKTRVPSSRKSSQISSAPL